MIRLLRLLIGLVAGVYLVFFAVLNTGSVGLTLWPDFAPLTVPLWTLVLVLLFTGVLIGGASAWLGAVPAKVEARVLKRKANAQAWREERQEQEAEKVLAERVKARRRGEAEAARGLVLASNRTLALPSR